jgi:hypothetical protein
LTSLAGSLSWNRCDAAIANLIDVTRYTRGAFASEFYAVKAASAEISVKTVLG